MNKPICKNCKYYKRGFLFDPRTAKCKHPASAEIYLVDGSTSYLYCSAMRIDGPNKCGEDGRFFEPK